MKTDKLDNYTRGWLVGNYTPSLYNKNYELGFKYYNKGDYEKSHNHLLSDEVTVILFGEVEMNNVSYIKGDIVVQEKGEFTDFRCISDMAIVGVYRPDGSFPNDKYYKDV